MPFKAKPTFDAQLEEIKANKFNADVPELKDVDERAKVCCPKRDGRGGPG